MSSETYLVEVNTDDLRCATGFDGGAKCAHFHEYRTRSFLFGANVDTPVCGLFGRELKKYDTERIPVVARCSLCVEAFGTHDRPAHFERFDVPVNDIYRTKEIPYAQRDTDRAPPPTGAISRSMGTYIPLRAVESPTHGARGR